MIYLASQSPRRSELLQQMQVPFQTLSVDVDETPFENELPEDLVARLALSKALTGWNSIAERREHLAPVLGSDTIVVCRDQILGKPRNQNEFIQMFHSLSGNTHKVITAVAVVQDKKKRIIIQTSSVTFCELSEQEMVNYWNTGEPQDKAGGYGIQGIAAMFITHMEGSYSGVMGLPIYETTKLLKQFGVLCGSGTPIATDKRVAS